MAAYSGTDGSDIILGTGEDDIVTEFGVGEDVVTTFGGDDTVRVTPDGGSLLEILPDLVILGPGADDHLIIDYRGASEALTGSPLQIDLVEDGLGGSVSLGGILSLTFLGVDRFTVLGGDGRDFFIGGGGDDVLSGARGADTFFGGDGDDRLLGGAGRDTLTGEVGRDRLSGGADDDVLDGGLGADRLNGGDGDDRLEGGGAADVLGGADGNDVLNGGGGADTLNGGDGDDRIHAGSGVDIVKGGTGADRLYGGGSADTIEGGSGDDYMAGGSGNDLFVFRGPSGADVIADFKAGEGAGDVIAFRADLFTDFADVKAHTTNDGLGNCVIAKDGVSIMLEGVIRGRLAEDDFVFTAGAASIDAVAMPDETFDPLILPTGFEAKAEAETMVICPPGEAPGGTNLSAQEMGLSDFGGRDPHARSGQPAFDWIV